MCRIIFSLVVIVLAMCLGSQRVCAQQTTVGITGESFTINGKLTYAGRYWHRQRIEGLLMNSRMVQATFDDKNSATRDLWKYPDSGKWDPDRNTSEFIAAMPVWRDHGLLAITINLQGGSPQGYSNAQPWNNSGFQPDGSLEPSTMERTQRVIEAADRLGMVIILGYFYFGQDERLQDEAAVIRAVNLATQWILDKGYKNVLVEVNNECNVSKYDHEILKPARVHELIELVKSHTRDGQRLLVGTSYGGNKVPESNVVKVSDFLLMHGNGVKDPKRIAEMVRLARKIDGYRPMPILFNEDDHFDFDQPLCNFTSAVSEYASWGFFDYRMKDEGFDEGFQSVPVNWQISSDRKRGFFELLKEITGSSRP